MSGRSCCLVTALVLACAGHALAVPWVKLVEVVAERATTAEARTGERFAMREAEAASGVVTRRVVSAPDELAVLGRFDRLQGVDDALRAEFKALSPAERHLVVELGEGAQRVLRLHPGRDGTRLLQHLDAVGLAQSRTYGDFVLDGMAWLQSEEALDALRGPIPVEGRSAIAEVLGLKRAPAELGENEVATLWKSVVRKTGDGAGEFWAKYVAPHKGKWLGGGLLVTYLAMPERFHDAAGRLTEYGAKEVGKLIGDSVLGAGRGFFGAIGDSLQQHYAESPKATIVTVALVVVLLLSAVPRVRALLWPKGLQGNWAAATTPTRERATSGRGATSTLPTHAPFKE